MFSGLLAVHIGFHLVWAFMTSKWIRLEADSAMIQDIVAQADHVDLVFTVQSTQVIATSEMAP